MYLQGLSSCAPDTVLNMPNDGRQFTTRDNRTTCESRGGLFSEGGCWIKDGGVCTSWLPDKCVYRGVCQAPATNTTNVTTQVSPQISPNLIQQQQPTNSPVGATTSQTGSSGGGYDYQALLEQIAAQQEAAAQRTLDMQRAMIDSMRTQSAPVPISVSTPMPPLMPTQSGDVESTGTNPMIYAAGAAFAMAALMAVLNRRRK